MGRDIRSAQRVTMSLTNTLKTAIALSAIVLSGCAGDGPVANDTSYLTHRIDLPPLGKSELGEVRSTAQSEPYRGGVPRSLSPAQRRISLARLRWGPLRSTGYVAVVAVHSPAAKSLRAGLRLSSNLPGVQIAFRDAMTTVAVVPAAPLATPSAPYWGPVVQGDTIWIEIRATAPIQDGTILEIAALSHLL